VVCAIRFAFSGAKVVLFFNIQAFWQKKLKKVLFNHGFGHGCCAISLAGAQLQNPF
jgi:hypothetical protein